MSKKSTEITATLIPTILDEDGTTAGQTSVFARQRILSNNQRILYEEIAVIEGVLEVLNTVTMVALGQNITEVKASIDNLKVVVDEIAKRVGYSKPLRH